MYASAAVPALFPLTFAAMLFEIKFDVVDEVLIIASFNTEHADVESVDI